MRFLLAFALMIIGLMALPIGSNVDRRSSNKTIGTKILENLDGFRFEDKVETLVDSMRGNYFME
ncbi:Bgt-55104 [Blumeria graminis f. sp. tritici]|uniref:Bgt-55104 n=1 Tax=Blumeria graminis f. sp. tritici TaxID=62690 RepID=A0A9X9QDE9_BLUGR|nr:Bgt-55104 [Blumeria graminis f. sp. tritici]